MTDFLTCEETLPYITLNFASLLPGREKLREHLTETEIHPLLLGDLYACETGILDEVLGYISAAVTAHEGFERSAKLVRFWFEELGKNSKIKYFLLQSPHLDGGKALPRLYSNHKGFMTAAVSPNFAGVSDGTSKACRNGLLLIVELLAHVGQANNRPWWHVDYALTREDIDDFMVTVRHLLAVKVDARSVGFLD